MSTTKNDRRNEAKRKLRIAKKLTAFVNALAIHHNRKLSVEDLKNTENGFMLQNERFLNELLASAEVTAWMLWHHSDYRFDDSVFFNAILRKAIV